jgi:hypothetical protein
VEVLKTMGVEAVEVRTAEQLVPLLFFFLDEGI